MADALDRLPEPDPDPIGPPPRPLVEQAIALFIGAR
jgi:hypothetical protein